MKGQQVSICIYVYLCIYVCIHTCVLLDSPHFLQHRFSVRMPRLDLRVRHPSRGVRCNGSPGAFRRAGLGTDAAFETQLASLHGWELLSIPTQTTCSASATSLPCWSLCFSLALCSSHWAALAWGLGMSLDRGARSAGTSNMITCRRLPAVTVPGHPGALTTSREVH